MSEIDWHGHYCAICGGLGVQVSIGPGGLARRVDEQGHEWVGRPNEVVLELDAPPTEHP
jgi:hypothetical protein